MNAPDTTSDELLRDQALLRRVLLRMVLALAGLTILFGFIGWLFRETFVAVSRQFVETFGALGVVIGFAIPDATNVPLPHDAFFAIGLVGGLDFWFLVMCASSGSLMGGICGYAGSRRFVRTRRFQRWLSGPGKRYHLITKRYGGWALALGALTPLPYAVLCWLAGAGGMRVRSFLLISLLRIPRVILYGAFIKLGVINVIGVF